MIIESITRQFDEDTTRLHLLGWKVIFTARPIRAWNRAYWGTWPGPGFRGQCPWATLVIVRK